jgi:hypothetical protein
MASDIADPPTKATPSTPAFAPAVHHLRSIGVMVLAGVIANALSAGILHFIAPGPYSAVAQAFLAAFVVAYIVDAAITVVYIWLPYYDATTARRMGPALDLTLHVVREKLADDLHGEFNKTTRDLDRVVQLAESVEVTELTRISVRRFRKALRSTLALLVISPPLAWLFAVYVLNGLGSNGVIASLVGGFSFFLAVLPAITVVQPEPLGLKWWADRISDLYEEGEAGIKSEMDRLGKERIRKRREVYAAAEEYQPPPT